MLSVPVGTESVTIVPACMLFSLQEFELVDFVTVYFAKPTSLRDNKGNTSFVRIGNHIEYGLCKCSDVGEY